MAKKFKKISDAKIAKIRAEIAASNASYEANVDFLDRSCSSYQRALEGILEANGVPKKSWNDSVWNV